MSRVERGEGRGPTARSQRERARRIEVGMHGRRTARIRSDELAGVEEVPPAPLPGTRYDDGLPGSRRSAMVRRSAPIAPRKRSRDRETIGWPARDAHERDDTTRGRGPRHHHAATARRGLSTTKKRWERAAENRRGLSGVYCTRNSCTNSSRTVREPSGDSPSHRTQPTPASPLTRGPPLRDPDSPRQYSGGNRPMGKY